MLVDDVTCPILGSRGGLCVTSREWWVTDRDVFGAEHFSHDHLFVCVACAHGEQ